MSAEWKFFLPTIDRERLGEERANQIMCAVELMQKRYVAAEARIAALESQLARASTALGDAERAMEGLRVDVKHGTGREPYGVCHCADCKRNTALDIAIAAVRKARTP